MTISVRELTNGERLLIDRRRRGEKQLLAAERYGVTYHIYSQWERDVVEGPNVPISGGLQPYERCLLYRRRSKKTQREVASDLGRCPMWVNHMERGLIPTDELVWYWEQ